jgi:hypothetical protein
LRWSPASANGTGCPARRRLAADLGGALAVALVVALAVALTAALARAVHDPAEVRNPVRSRDDLDFVAA